MSRPLSRGPQFDDDADLDAAVERTEHIDRGRPTERIDLAQMEAQPGATEAIAMPPGDEGWGYLPPSTSTPQLAASPDQRSQYTQVLQPVPARQTMSTPVQPVYASPEPARRTVSQVPVQETWGEPEQVDTVLGKVEDLGVPIPWRDEIIKTIRSAKDVVS